MLKISCQIPKTMVEIKHQKNDREILTEKLEYSTKIFHNNKTFLGWKNIN
jgi:hypothetical protein